MMVGVGWLSSIMRHMGTAGADDDLPTHKATSAKRTRGCFRNFFVFIGAFHGVLTARRINGKLFRKTHVTVKTNFLAWRTYNKQLDWVLDPGDPNSVDDGNVMTVIARYVVAIWAVQDKKL